MLFTRSATQLGGVRQRRRATGARPVGAAVVMCAVLSALAVAQTQKPPVTQPPAPAAPSGNTTASVPGNTTASVPKGVPLTPDYVIGPDDVITVVVWKEPDVSGDFTVRPDGKISLPLMNDISVAGLTPDQLRGRITEAASKFIEDPTVTIVVKQVNSRKVFVMGQVVKPGPYPLTAPTTVLQLLSMAGGLLEYANDDNISILRTVNGQQVSYPFSYKAVMRRRNLHQNIELKPGDTVVVP